MPRHLEQFVIFSIKAPALDLGFRSLCCRGHATEGCIELFLTVHVKMRLSGLIFILPRACWRVFQKHCFSSPDFAFLSCPYSHCDSRQSLRCDGEEEFIRIHRPNLIMICRGLTVAAPSGGFQNLPAGACPCFSGFSIMNPARDFLAFPS